MTNKKLIKEASIENNFDEAVSKFAEGFGIDISSTPCFNVLPNVRSVKRIMNVGNVKYREFGLWIVSNTPLNSKKYDSLNSVYDALEKSELFPLIGENWNFTDFLDIQ